MLEFVKSQYGAAVLGLLTFPVFGHRNICFYCANYSRFISNCFTELKNAITKLNPSQQLGLLLFPAIGPVLIGASLGAEAAEKVKELNFR